MPEDGNWGANAELDALDSLLYRIGQTRLGERATLLVRTTRHLLPACLKEAGERADDPDAGYHCVTSALSLVDDLQTCLTDGRKPEGYHGRLWVHTAELPNPASFEDKHAIMKNEVLESAARYLSIPWLSCGYLDWVYIDALVRGEVVGFEYEVHEARHQFNLFPSTPLVSWLTRGGLAFLVEAVIAAAVSWWLYSEYSTDAPYRNLWGLCAAAYYIFYAGGLLRQARRNRKAKALAAEANAKMDHLIALMKWCYHQLDSPVLDPSRIRDNFRKAEELGTRWPSAVGPVLENAIRRDPAIWITERP